MWIDVLRGPAGAETSPGSSSNYRDPATGWIYRAVYSSNGIGPDGNPAAGVQVNFVGVDGPYYKGQVGHRYELSGQESGTFVVEDFHASDPLEKLTLGLILAAATLGIAGAAGFGPAAAGAGADAAVPTAASLGPGESLVTGGAAFQPATFGTTGAIGAYPAATGTGFAYTEFAAATAATAAGTVAASTASAVGPIGTTAAGLAATAAKLTAVAASVLGVVPGSRPGTSGAQQQPMQGGSAPVGSNALVYAAAAALAFFALH
jgi:hypothetical protein